MSEGTAGSRFRSVMVDVLLSLINATLILFIAALVLLIVAINKVETFSRSVVVAVAKEIIEPVNARAEEIKVQLETLNGQLKSRLARRDNDPNVEDSAEETSQTPALADQLKNLSERLKEFSAKSRNLGELITDRAIASAGTAFADAVIRIRNCSRKTTRQRDYETRTP